MQGKNLLSHSDYCIFRGEERGGAAKKKYPLKSMSYGVSNFR